MTFPTSLILKSATFDFAERAHVMGILNVTSDSFSDGGRFIHPTSALDHVRQMVAEGADLIDVGGESTRPGAQQVSVAEELDRVMPVIEMMTREFEVPLSIDTTKSEVARAAIAAGCEMINDISAGQMDPEIFQVAAQERVPLVLSHIQGTPQNMQAKPTYKNVVTDVKESLRGWIQQALAAGVRKEQLVVDPGIGFGKTTQHNLALLDGLSELATLGFPILIGTSRKSFIGHLLGDVPPSKRLEGTAATVALAIAQGANIVRVHDVAPMVQVAKIADAVLRVSVA